MKGWLEWAVAERPLLGETVSGDQFCVESFDNVTLLAVSDGLGHGEEAAAASHRALQTVRENSGRSLPEIMDRCDQNLRETRGAVMTLAKVDSQLNSLSWLSVGNVSCALLNSETGSWDEVFLRPGILGGHRYQSREAEVLPLRQGDYVIFATDGVKPGYLSRVSLSGSPGEIARGVLAGYGKADDDALVLVARYRSQVR